VDELENMPNVGPVLASNLRAVGIETPAELIGVGSKDAFARIRESEDPGACLHMLYGLEGAVQGIPDSRLSTADKDDLKSYFRRLEAEQRTAR